MSMPKHHLGGITEGPRRWEELATQLEYRNQRCVWCQAFYGEAEFLAGLLLG